MQTEQSPATLERILAFLRDPAGHPDSPKSIECIETHMSWVFLSTRFVYKMKKPVVLPYLDFSTLEKRLANCREEVRLNRRLAPGVYLDVIAVSLSRQDRLMLDHSGQPLEWLVKMRRLPRELMLDQALAADHVGASDLRHCAQVLAAFYEKCRPEICTPDKYLNRLHQAIREDVDGLAHARYRLQASMFREPAERLVEYLANQSACFEDRVCQGHVVEGHGDLRPEHVCLTRPPVFIDCLEFSRELRTLDVADDLACLFLECECLGTSTVEHELGGEYRKRSGDPLPAGLLAFHKSRRALLRARLCLAHLLDHPSPQIEQHWRDRAADYLLRAARHADALDQVVTK